MNWQYVKNVEPPRNRIIMLLNRVNGDVLFARIRDDGMMERSWSYYNHGIGMCPDEYPWEQFLKTWPNIMWCLFIKP